MIGDAPGLREAPRPADPACRSPAHRPATCGRARCWLSSRLFAPPVSRQNARWSSVRRPA